MSRKRTKYRLPIPATKNPPGRLCVSFQIPDDIDHIAAFWGYFRGIGSALAWKDDRDHNAREIAALWWGIYQDAHRAFLATKGQCCIGDGMQFRQNGCKLEYSIDCIVWHTLYDPSNCFKGQSGTEPPGGDLAPGECREFGAEMNADTRWTIPIPVRAGYRVEIVNPTGSWTDNSDIWATWRCPNGGVYFAGACGLVTVLEEDDPAPTMPHMSLVGIINGQGWWNGQGVYVVPEGVEWAQMVFQANDSDITNNMGKVSFVVRVCRDALPVAEQVVVTPGNILTVVSENEWIVEQETPNAAFDTYTLSFQIRNDTQALCYSYSASTTGWTQPTETGVYTTFDDENCVPHGVNGGYYRETNPDVFYTATFKNRTYFYIRSQTPISLHVTREN
jgi:hypothetical protein